MMIFRIGILLIFSALVFGCASAVETESVDSDVRTKDDSAPKEESVSKKGVTASDAEKTALKAGAKMPSFELLNAKNETIKSSNLLTNSNLVVVFYRGGWCPFCNTYLKDLQDNLKAINAEGGKLVAISAEKPDNSLTTAEKNELAFDVLSDDKLAFSRKMGLVFELDAETDKKYQANGIELVESNGTDKPELPIPATYIVKSDGEIAFAFVDPDYKKRLKPADVIAELKKLKGK